MFFVVVLIYYCDSVSLKPHRKKKPFIEKKKAVSFHLVHRSQRDPLAADETAPQRVLLPPKKIYDEECGQNRGSYEDCFDDDYDHLQHLKEASGPYMLKSKLPSLHITRERRKRRLG